jgi:hypothetical protein
VVECLPSIPEALDSIPALQKKKKKKPNPKNNACVKEG